ncbi:flagellar basal-body MS-ring/collar protein FliF [Chitinimonas sp. BJB300]|uniref:flagellar basal-body MS-ring/collar protein FliF n=1 Tax=Chitinimonas sp. BJB300 TaxID=1559339 RepID=UPI000C106E2E|nr:flagellar basal-body MS-ring/collar protein FliF [Chitinimonas sp. BJB300]PHV12875.1 flagellar M-ring protein FliF [Chitinimonas sp. BJB300]TSJ86093.1 flagellar M-ring protein FliF [Chitinimonas sp. BJB300]
MFSQLWNKLDSKARAGLVTAVLAVIILTSALAWWVFRQDNRVLFAGLSAQDASAMVAELDRMKVPYQLDQDGGTILVAADTVHKTRLQVLGKDIPLHGTVGFELFNNSDFGMTEFAQKVNYQRALQGEITRTILAIDVIQSARVHLALPEQGLFIRAGAQPKASVTLTLKPDRQLSAEQVRGIQRLVSASVAEVRAEDVTVIDQHGVALSRASGLATNDAFSSDMLDRKRAVESYLGRKLDSVLERSFGAGKVVASVDVELNDKVIKQTTEDMLPTDKERGTGVIVRERQTSRPTGAAEHGKDETTQSEFDYQIGRRVEQTERNPGGTERISVAVVLRAPMNEDEQARLKDIVANTVGLVPSRGDGIAVYSMAQLAAGNVAAALVDTPIAPEPTPGEATPMAVSEQPAVNRMTDWIISGALLLGLMVVGLLMLGFLRQRYATPLVAKRTLSDAEREQALHQVQAWLNEPSIAAEEHTR